MKVADFVPDYYKELNLGPSDIDDSNLQAFSQELIDSLLGDTEAESSGSSKPTGSSSQEDKGPEPSKSSDGGTGGPKAPPP
jgi:hypothetical protein